MRKKPKTPNSAVRKWDQVLLNVSILHEETYYFNANFRELHNSCIILMLIFVNYTILVKISST